MESAAWKTTPPTRAQRRRPSVAPRVMSRDGDGRHGEDSRQPEKKCQDQSAAQRATAMKNAIGGGVTVATVSNRGIGLTEARSAVDGTRGVDRTSIAGAKGPPGCDDFQRDATKETRSDLSAGSPGVKRGAGDGRDKRSRGREQRQDEPGSVDIASHVQTAGQPDYK